MTVFRALGNSSTLILSPGLWRFTARSCWGRDGLCVDRDDDVAADLVALPVDDDAVVPAFMPALAAALPFSTFWTSSPLFAGSGNSSASWA